MARLLRYPTGVRALLVQEAARLRRAETRLVALLDEAGFAEVVLPILDYAEPYAPLIDKRGYRFVDREGELVAIRSDFTPMVARALAPSLTADDLPLRVFYRGDVIRCEATRLGAGRELFQIGGEIIGDGSLEADLDVLRLAAASVQALGVAPLVVCGDVSGDATRLAQIEKAIPDVRIHVEDEPPGYYTGLRFRVYDRDSRRLLAQGGRYDALYARFGFDAPAVGFTVTVDEVTA